MRAGQMVRRAMVTVRELSVEIARNTFMPDLGGRPDPATCANSPQWRDGMFRNAAPPRPAPARARDGLFREFLRRDVSRAPSGPVPLVREVPEPAGSGLHVTWFGHSSTLVEIDGARLLFDPVWSKRPTPLTPLGPRRMHPLPRGLTELPALDAVVISHDHYDHLDAPTVRTLARSDSMSFVVPLGVGTHLRRWGVAAERITELDWDDSVELAGLRLTATAAQHFSGRALTPNDTLWASWVVAGAHHRIFYTGDSGYFSGYAEIGAEHGPFDATLVQIGAYNVAWPDIHMTPEEGVAAHRDVGGRVLIPVHWATFKLALHSWPEPAERVWAEAKSSGVALAVPRPGERIDVASPPAVEPWWQALAARGRDRSPDVRGDDSLDVAFGERRDRDERVDSGGARNE